MSELKRYTLAIDDTLTEYDDGEYTYYESAKAIIDKLQAKLKLAEEAIEASREILEECTKLMDYQGLSREQDNKVVHALKAIAAFDQAKEKDGI